MNISSAIRPRNLCSSFSNDNPPTAVGSTTKFLESSGEDNLYLREEEEVQQTKDKEQKVKKLPISLMTSNLKESHERREDNKQPHIVGNMWDSNCLSKRYRNDSLVSENSNVIRKEIPDEALPRDEALQELLVSKSGESDGETASKIMLQEAFVEEGLDLV